MRRRHDHIGGIALGLDERHEPNLGVDGLVHRGEAGRETDGVVVGAVKVVVCGREGEVGVEEDREANVVGREEHGLEVDSGMAVECGTDELVGEKRVHNVSMQTTILLKLKLLERRRGGKASCAYFYLVGDLPQKRIHPATRDIGWHERAADTGIHQNEALVALP